MKSKDILLRIIQSKPKISTYRLAKYIYLFDLAFIQLAGRQKTNLPYKWLLYGPYCDNIEEILWDLEEEHLINREHIQTKKYECTLHSSNVKKKPELDKLEEMVIKYIVTKFSKYSLDDLSDFIYSTPPMIEAKEKQKKYKRINMKSKKGLPKIFPNSETVEMILKSEESFKKGKASSFEQVWAKLEKKCADKRIA